MKKSLNILMYFFLLMLNFYPSTAQRWEKLPTNIILSHFFVSHDTILSANANNIQMVTNYGDGPVKTWNVPIGSISSTIAIKGSNFIYGTLSDGVIVSHNYGETWNIAKESGKDKIYKPSLIRYRMEINGDNLYLPDLGSGYLYISTDNGDTWSKYTNNHDSTGTTEILSFGFFDNCLFMVNCLLLKSCDNSKTWAWIHLPGIENSSCVEIIDMMRQDSIFYLLYADENYSTGYYDNFLFRTTDNGNSWDKIVLDKEKWSEHIISCGKNLFMSGFYFGVMFSSDYGNSWKQISDGIDTSKSKFRGGKIQLNDKYIYYVNSSSWRLPLCNCEPLWTGINEPANSPIIIEISPNPVSDFLTINNIQSFVQSHKIEIFSALGIKLIETEYKERIDVSGMAPGVYFVKVGDKVAKFIKYEV